MTDLLDRLEKIAGLSDKLDAPFIEAAIGRIKELEAELHGFREDLSEWQIAVRTQMGRRTDDAETPDP